MNHLRRQLALLLHTAGWLIDQDAHWQIRAIAIKHGRR